MSEDGFDVIIVGAGLAGSSAALTAARANLSTLVLERSATPGQKNMTGGRIYTHTLESLLPGFAEDAPIERRIVKERISFLNADAATTLEYAREPANGGDWSAGSCTVLRAKFDEWLMGKAEAAGAELVAGICIDDLLIRDGKVCGVIADGEEVESNAVILAEGANALLGEKLGMVTRPTPAQCAVGAKELIKLDASVINERFGCSGDDGVAWLFSGMPSDGQMGGGFLYTNRESVSLGVVFGLEHVAKVGKSVPQMLEDFKNNPLIKPLIAGGTLEEYSAHLVQEGGFASIPKLVGNGVLIAGDAAAFCINLGYTVRGMDLAIASGAAAARAVIRAAAENDFSEAGLGVYQKELEQAHVLPDMKLYRRMPSFIDTPRLFGAYPDMVAAFMNDLFTVSGPSRPLWRKGMDQLRKVGLVNIIKDGFNGVRAL